MAAEDDVAGRRAEPERLRVVADLHFNVLVDARLTYAESLQVEV